MLLRLLSAATAATLLPGIARAQAFNLDVGQNTILSPTPSDAYGAAAAQPGRWNAVPPSFTPQILDDLLGNPTAVTVVADDTSSRNVFPPVMPPGDDQKLMEDLGALPNLNILVTWTFQGLIDGPYEVVTYAADPSSNNIMTRVDVVGSLDGAQTVGGSWPGQHVFGVTYAFHTVVVANGTLQVELLGIGQPLFEFGALNGFQIVPAFPPPATNYCGPALPNSSGASATIAASGSFIAGQPILLVASSLPQNQFGYFLVSRDQGLINPPGSQGLLCLSGSIGRFNAPGQIGNSGAAGAIDLTVDTTAIPVNPPTPVAPGESWNFQCWFRDNNPIPTSNFTDGVEVTFL